VGLVRTTPESVLDDLGAVMRAAGYREHLDAAAETALKINISWHHWYPACSTTPWQLDGVIRALRQDGFDTERLFGAHNRTVVVDAHVGERTNKHRPVLEAHGIRNVHLYEDEDWLRYEPRGRLRTLHQVFPEGIRIPRRMMGTNVIHLPTVKTHVFTTITGAMKNAFGGLLFEKRHYCHATIHETLVDLLRIQTEIHRGIFAVVDGTFTGDGPGPRCMRVQERGLLLAGADQVAVDATIARLMGLDPFDIPFIRMAHEDGLGSADAAEIEIVGEELEAVRWQANIRRDTLASRGQKAIYWGPLQPLEKLLLRTAIAPWSYAASRLYHDVYWYNLHGRGRARRALQGPWGRLFVSYPHEGSELPEPFAAGTAATDGAGELEVH
jgi:uncharacterized protein (DUF362 family)